MYLPFKPKRRTKAQIAAAITGFSRWLTRCCPIDTRPEREAVNM